MLKKSAPTQLQLGTIRFTLAHLAVQQATCSWCGAPVKVEPPQLGHIRVPNCGCLTEEERPNESE